MKVISKLHYNGIMYDKKGGSQQTVNQKELEIFCFSSSDKK